MATRRKLLTTIGLYAIVAPLALFGQQTGKILRIGFIWPGSATVGRADIDVIKQRLRELGHVEGRDFTVEYRWAEGKAELFPRFAAELVRLKVDVIVTRSTPAALAAKAATREIPIVFSMVSDPVASGIVERLARPGGNITGWSNILPETIGKLLELLKLAVPRMSRVAVLPLREGKKPDRPVGRIVFLSHARWHGAPSAR